MIIPYKSQLRHWWDAHFPAEIQEEVSVASAWTGPQLGFAWATLVITALVVLLPNLSYPLIEPDETRYAQIALEMNQSRDWITPTLDGQAYLDKPPLMYWLTAISFHIFGNHETAARIPSMLAALLTILFTFGLGSRIIGRRSAWLGAMSLALCAGFVLAGRFLILDSLLAFWTTICMLSGYLAVRGQRHRWVWWMIAGMACALGVLTKGPLALVLCAPPLVVSGWLRADHSRTRFWHWGAFVLPMVAVCVPWYVAVAKFNPQFVDYFFWEHNFKRFTQGSNHEQPFWFYIPVIFAAMFPASLLLPSVGVFVLSRSRRNRSLRTKDLGFLTCGAVWMLVFFSAASCKLPTYILPAIPLLCLLTGAMLDQTVFRRGASDRITAYLRPFPQRANLILVVSCLLLVCVDGWFGGGLSASGVLALTASLAVLLATVKVWNREVAFGQQAWVGTAGVAICVTLFASAVVLPTISTERSVFVETRRIADAAPNAWIVFLGEKSHGALFHLPPQRTTYFPFELEEEFAGFASQQADFILVTDEQRIEKIKQTLAETHKLSMSPNHEHVYRASRILPAVASLPGTGEVNR